MLIYVNCVVNGEQDEQDDTVPPIQVSNVVHVMLLLIN